MPWSDQDASGEIAAMAIGASLWGLYNQTGEFSVHLTKPFLMSYRSNYRCFWQPGSEVFDKARATGLPGQRLAERHHRQHGRPTLFRTKPRAISAPSVTLARSRTIVTVTGATPSEHEYRPVQLGERGDGRLRRRP